MFLSKDHHNKMGRPPMQMKSLLKLPIRLSLALCLLAACKPGPVANVDQGGTGNLDQGVNDAGTCTVTATEDLRQCTHAATDYEPRVNGSANDTWPVCISDDNQFHLIGPGTPSAAARMMTFITMGSKLWNNPSPPSFQDFLDARDLYSISQGIGSRVERRQDIHYPEIPGDNKLRCSEPGIPDQYPDRCAGPARILPIVNDAFQRGLAQSEPRVQAARLEAALLWFFYLSTISEIWTCSFDDIVDCDSMWGYYNAAMPREQPLGFAAYIDAQSPETHQRAFDALLAVRCWRDLDRTLPAQDLSRYEQVVNQLDRAELRGLARILRTRFAYLRCTTGEVQRAHLAFISVLGQFMDRAARAIDQARADVLQQQYSASSPDAVDVSAAQAALDALFPCP
jgi:hypothetical protein